MRNIFTSKTDLARAYFPYIGERSARQKLMSLINEDSELYSKLLESGYMPRNHEFSPAQVQMIFEKYGNPFN